jgi:hypothetical protein
MSTDELLFTTGDLSSALTASRAGQVIIGDNNYFGAGFEADLVGAGLCLLRPAAKANPNGRVPGSSNQPPGRGCFSVFR